MPSQGQFRSFKFNARNGDFICCGVELGSSEQDLTMERKDSPSVMLKKVSVC